MGNVNLLEKNMEKILDLAGFNPEVRTNLEGYEIDVLLEYKTIQAIFECKQYQKGNLTVRNLIHEWTGKNEEIRADRVILVLVGVNVSEEDYELAEKRDITIWEGDKVDKLLDKATEGQENIKEQILSEAGLDSTKEIQEKIEEVTDSYNVSKRTAKKYLSGEIEKNKLVKKSEFNDKFEKKEDDVLENLSSRDRRRYVNNEDYYGTNFQKVVEMMIKYDTDNKKIAHVLVNNQGGKVDGNHYSSTSVKKAKLLSDNLDLPIYDAFRVLSNWKNRYGNYPQMRFLRRLSKVKSERDDLTFHEVKQLFEEGYTVPELKNNQEDENGSEDHREDNIENKDNSGEENLNEDKEDQNNDQKSILAELEEYETDDSDLARILVDNNGGSWNGKEYSSDTVKKAKYIADNFNFPIEESFRILENMKKRRDGEYPERKFLKRTSKVKSERKHLSFHEVKDYFEKGYTVDDLINEQDKRKEQSDNEESNRNDEEGKEEIKKHGEKKGQKRDFKNLDKFIIKEEDKDRTNYTHILICPDCKSERPVDVTKHEKSSRLQCKNCRSWYEIENIEQYQEYENEKVTINPKSNQQAVSFNCPYCNNEVIKKVSSPQSKEKISCEECNKYFIIESKENKESENTAIKGLFKNISDIFRG